MDKAHKATDKRLEAMERELAAIYREAQKGISDKAAAYFDQFIKQDEKKKALVADGKLSEDEYLKWRKNKILYSKRFVTLQGQITGELARVNQTAAAYINDQLPDVYALNYNYVGKGVQRAVKGYSFTLIDANTVKRLATKTDGLLPKRKVDVPKDKLWNAKKMRTQVLQGILQGESMDKIADRMQTVTDMNGVSAIRNARTMVTGAENAGRIDMMHKAATDGVIMRKRWIATTDSRTRDWHRDLDGVEVDMDEPFHNDFGDIMFPGDPTAAGANVYNCRCTLGYRVAGFGNAQVQKAMAEKQGEEPQATAFTPAKTKTEAVQFSKTKLNMEVVDFGQATLEVSNEINRVIGNVFDKYPEIQINRIISDSPNVRYTLAMHKTNLVQKTGKLTEGTFELGNVQNKKLSEVEDKLSKLVKSGYSVKTDAGYLETVIWHEAGHQYGTYIESELFKKMYPDFGTNDKAYISYLTDVQKKKFYNDILKEAKTDMKKRGFVFDVKNISQYASKNSSEMFAEAFAEINCSKNPSEEAKTIIRIAEGKLK